MGQTYDVCIIRAVVYASNVPLPVYQLKISSVNEILQASISVFHHCEVAFTGELVNVFLVAGR